MGFVIGAAVAASALPPNIPPPGAGAGAAVRTGMAPIEKADAGAGLPKEKAGADAAGAVIDGLPNAPCSEAGVEVALGASERLALYSLERPPAR